MIKEKAEVIDDQLGGVLADKLLTENIKLMKFFLNLKNASKEEIADISNDIKNLAEKMERLEKNPT